MEFLKSQSQSVFRAKQIYDWFFRKGRQFRRDVGSSRVVTDRAGGRYLLHPLRIRRQEESRQDGTIRYFFEAHDHETVSTVTFRMPDRLSLCLPAQVGCRPTAANSAPRGFVPFKRQLSAAEILDQIPAD